VRQADAALRSWCDFEAGCRPEKDEALATDGGERSSRDSSPVIF
jgi:hypothetical protein